MVSRFSELRHIPGSGIKSKMGLDHGGCQQLKYQLILKTKENHTSLSMKCRGGMSFHYPSALRVRETTSN